MTTVPASDKHYTARIIERKDLAQDLWLIRVDPGGRPRTFVGIPACAKTGKASSAAPAGRKAPCSKRSISSQEKKREPSSAAYTRVDFWRGRCTMRPGQNPSLNQVWFFESEGAS
jgi:hypothetical protein